MCTSLRTNFPRGRGLIGIDNMAWAFVSKFKAATYIHNQVHLKMQSKRKSIEK